jgi:hypothetical protein
MCKARTFESTTFQFRNELLVRNSKPLLATRRLSEANDAIAWRESAHPTFHLPFSLTKFTKIGSPLKQTFLSWKHDKPDCFVYEHFANTVGFPFEHEWHQFNQSHVMQQLSRAEAT